jgi:2-amino-4-hydroxy-6-hydroxymethyldihydropteridine diphosphokinase
MEGSSNQKPVTSNQKPECCAIKGRVICYIGVGSNVGDRQAYIDRATEELKRTPNVRIIKISSIYETEPVGGLPQGKFLNGVLGIQTSLGPKEVLRELNRIEANLGRRRLARNGPRTIDLDILLYGDRIVRDGDIEIPHPRMLERDFVLKPLCEIAPDVIHPVLGLSIKNLAAR